MEQIKQFFRSWWTSVITPLDAETNADFGISDASLPEGYDENDRGTPVADLRPLTA